MKVIDAKPKSPESPLVGGVIVSHGHLGSEFLATAEMILGPISHMTAASIDWHDDVDVARNELERAMARVSRGRGVLLMTDMFGGAPTDISSMLLDDPAVEVVSGVNLPMVLKLANKSPTCRWLKSQRRCGIAVKTEFISPASCYRARINLTSPFPLTP
jgi:PTS system mannose-specific IIA component